MTQIAYFPDDEPGSQDRCLQNTAVTFNKSLEAGYDRIVAAGLDRPVNLLTELDSLNHRLGRIIRASNKPSAVGVFGPSQVGKSYLIDQLLGGRADPDNGVVLDVGVGIPFTGEEGVNQDKGAPTESTAVVCRFTAHPMAGESDCFQAKVISQEDLLRSMINGFVKECDPKDISRDAVLDPLLERIGKLPDHDNSERRPFWKMVPRTLDYIQDYHSDNPYYSRLIYDKNINERLGKVICKNPDQELLVASVFWGGLAGITQLYEKLRSEIDRIGASSSISIPVECVTAPDGSTKLVHVDNFKHILDDAEDFSITARDQPNGIPRKVSIRKAVLCALISELYLPVKQAEGAPSQDDLLLRGDVLDFPGVMPPKDKARFKADELDPEQVDDLTVLHEHTGRILARGKLTHLFEHYCAEREVSVLLLCIENNNLASDYLPSQVENWLATRYEEFKGIDDPALFMVITKLDMLLTADGPTDATRWLSLFSEIETFLGCGGSCTWFNTWPYSSGPGPFKNVFFVRHPAKKPANVGNLEAIRRGYEAFNLDDRYVCTGSASWEAAAAGLKYKEKYEDEQGREKRRKKIFGDPQGDGGFAFMREHLCGKFNPDHKRQELKLALAKVYDAAMAALKAMYDDGAADQEKRKDAKKQEARDMLAKLNDKRRLFPRVVEGLELTASDIHGVCGLLGEGDLMAFFDHLATQWVGAAQTRFQRLAQEDDVVKDALAELNQLVAVLRSMIMKKLCPQMIERLNEERIHGDYSSRDYRNLIIQIIATQWNDYVLKAGVEFTCAAMAPNSLPDIHRDDRPYDKFIEHWNQGNLDKLYRGSLDADPPKYNDCIGRMLEELRPLRDVFGKLYE